MPAEAVKRSSSRMRPLISMAMSDGESMPFLFSVTSRNASSMEIGSIKSVYSLNMECTCSDTSL